MPYTAPASSNRSNSVSSSRSNSILDSANPPTSQVVHYFKAHHGLPPTTQSDSDCGVGNEQTSPRNPKSFTLYELLISFDNGKKHFVLKRYREIKAFHTELRRLCAAQVNVQEIEASEKEQLNSILQIKFPSKPFVLFRKGPAFGGPRVLSLQHYINLILSLSLKSGASTAVKNLVRTFLELPRMNILNEILETERTYVLSLRMLVNVIMRPIRAQEILSPQDFQVIFPNIERVLSLNSEFLRNIERVLDGSRTYLSDSMGENTTQWRSVTTYRLSVGHLFAEYAPRFGEYSEFIASYPAAQALYEKLTSTSRNPGSVKGPQLAHFLLQSKPELEARGARTTELSAFLIMPIQRIPRYKLLLEDLLRHTLPGHREHNIINIALRKIGEIATWLNEMQREAEDAQRVANLAELLKMKDLVKKGRVLVREGALKITTKSSKKKPIPAMVYLFSDLLMCIVGGKREDYELDDPSMQVMNDLDKLGAPSFEVGSPSQSIHLICETDEERNAWIEDLKKYIPLKVESATSPTISPDLSSVDSRESGQ